MRPIALTIGEPAGIGPDIVLQLAQKSPDLFSDEKIIIIGNRALLRERAKLLRVACEHLSVIDIPLNDRVIPGKLNPRNAKFAIEMLTRAVNGALEKKFSAIVTAPVHKGIINDAGIAFKGHTDFFSRITKTDTVMMLMNADLKIALFTDHMPLRDVPNFLTEKNLSRCLDIVIDDFQTRWKIAQPRILICGLNPHAGEQGYLGSEEKNTMMPVIKQYQQKGFHVIGPMGADVAFTSKCRAKADVILAMYHDQGLPVIKYAGFSNAINVTLGLPFVRTSVDHGTALDIAGTGLADTNSLHQAILFATNVTK